MKKIRWGLAIIVVLATATLVLRSYADSSATVCRDHLAIVGTDAVVDVCGPIGITDLGVVALVLGALLFPDVAELTIPGIVTLKRKVNEQEAKQESLNRDISRLEQRITQSVTVNVFRDGRETARERFDKKIGQYKEGAGA